MISNRTYILLLTIILIFSACSVRQAILPEKLITSTNNIKVSDKKIQLVVDGGRDNDALGLPKISNEKLYKAIEKSIKNSKQFIEIVSENFDYTLEVFIVKLGQPVAGKVMKVNVEIAWILKDKDIIVFKKSIITTASKSSSEIANGLERLIVATEDATKKNIEKAMISISSKLNKLN